MSKAKPIFYSALLLTGVNLLLRFVGTSFQVYLSARIGAEGIGLLQLVLSVGTMTMVAGMGGIRTATMYLTAEELGRNHPGRVKWVLSGCLTYSIAISGAVALLVYSFAPFLAGNWIGDPQTLSAIRLFAVFLPVNCLTGVMVGYFTGAQRIGMLSAVEVAEQAASMVCTLALLHFWAGHNAAKCCLAVVMGSGIASCLTLACLMALRLRERHQPEPRIPIARRLASVALPLAVADDLRTGITTVENLIVPRRLALYSGTDSPLAAFGRVSGMVFPILMFPACLLYGLAELLIPELARCAAAGSHRRIHYLVRRSLKTALLYGVLLGGLLFLVAEPLSIRLYGDPEVGRQLRLYTLLIPMLYCDSITDAMTKGMGQQKICVRYNILTSFLDVVFLYILLPQYGMNGYFFSFLVTHLLNFILSLRRLLKITRESIPIHIPILSLCGAVMAAWAADHLIWVPGKIIAYLLLLGSLLYLFRVVNRADLRWFRQMVRQQKTPC